MRHAANYRSASRQRHTLGSHLHLDGELRDLRDTFGQRRRYGTENAWNTPDRDRDETQALRNEGVDDE